MGIQTSQVPVTMITARLFAGADNKLREALMPILMVALIALGVFGLIGLLLVVAVTLEQRKIDSHEPRGSKAA